MPGSGSDKRQRMHALRVRLSETEAAEIRKRADRAGLSVSAYLRASARPTALKSTPPVLGRKLLLNRRFPERTAPSAGRQ